MPVSAAVLAAGVTALVSLFLLARVLTAGVDPRARQRIMRWTALAFGIHIVAGILIELSGVTRADSDALYYDETARMIVDHWLHGLPLIPISEDHLFPPGQSGYFYMLAWLYRIVGPYPVAGLLVNAFFASALVPMMSEVTRRLFGPDAARYAPPVLIFTPGFLMWTSQLLREPAVLFFLSVAIYGAVRLTERATPAALLWVAVGVATLFSFRGYVALIVGTSLVVALFWTRRNSLRGVMTGISALLAVSVVVIGIGFGYSGFAAAREGSFQAANNLRVAQLAATNSAVAPGADTSTPTEALKSLPQLVPRYLLGPFPWEYRNTRQMIAFPDALAWWVLVPSLGRGAALAIRRHGRRTLVLLLPAGAATVWLSLLIAEYGTVVRSRLQVMVLLVPFIALGLAQGRHSNRATSPTGVTSPAPLGTHMAAPIGSSAMGSLSAVWGRHRHLLRVVRAYKWPIVLSWLAVVAVVLGVFARQTPLYEARAELLLTTSGAGGSPIGAQPVNVQTEIRVLLSAPIREAARQELGLNPRVRAEPVPGSNTYQVVARHEDPLVASKVANTFATLYLESRRAGAVERFNKATQETKGKIDGLQQQIDVLWTDILNTSDNRRGTLEQDFLGARRDALITEQAELKTRLDGLEIEAALERDGAQLITPAAVPHDPVQSRTKIVLLAVGLGLVMAGLVTYVASRIDETVRTASDVHGLRMDLPVIASIPRVVGRRKNSAGPLMSNKTMATAVGVEPFHSLRISLAFLMKDRPILQVTGPESGAGATTIVAYLASSFALSGCRVVVVSCDVRSPRLHEMFGLSNNVGLTDVVAGNASLKSAIQVVRGHSNLCVLTTGPPPPSPVEFLSSKRLGDVLHTLSDASDVVLLDSPPVLPVADAVLVASLADATLIVAAAGQTSRSALRRSVEVLHQVDAPVVGIALNYAAVDELYDHPNGVSQRRE